ncbi:MAG: hypothetical protein Q8K33_05535 [Cypionkella sp.]|jgi:hypothetical protein|uniref:hypothetical protein n=1 Tax=Cypionkella sp. TaxID=2811411 RepID=UPI0027315137|nr:hypothetical protein [Cypionkella sp.]MDP2048334.1 hypothetical protein [Cypionkella sp.]
MPLLLLVLLVSVFVYAWAARRNSTLTRDCRWRLDRRAGPSSYHCAACGAVCDPGAGRGPRQCLRVA